MGNFQIERDGYTAEWVDLKGVKLAVVRVTGPGLSQPMEWTDNGEDGLTQFEQAIELAKRYAEPVTRVHFRKIGHGGDVIALMPDEIFSTYRGQKYIASYMHVGQHSGADSCLIAELQPASEAEYMPLKRELESEPYKYRFEVLA